MTGYFAAVIIIFLGASVGLDPEEPLSASELAIELGIVVLYALGGALLLGSSGALAVSLLIVLPGALARMRAEDRVWRRAANAPTG